MRAATSLLVSPSSALRGRILRSSSSSSSSSSSTTTATATSPSLPLFVYGSLLSGFPNHGALFGDSVESVVSARVLGFTLAHFQVGGYPGMFPAPPLATQWRSNSSVEGQLLYLRAGLSADERRALFERLDSYEGCCGPAGHPENEYERSTVLAYPLSVVPTSASSSGTSDKGDSSSSGGSTAGNERVLAQTFICVIPRAMEALGGVVVHDGDWRKHMAAGEARWRYATMGTTGGLVPRA